MEPETSFPEAAVERILGQKDVQDLTNLSRTTLWRMEREGQFPQRLPAQGTQSRIPDAQFVRLWWFLLGIGGFDSSDQSVDDRTGPHDSRI